LEISKGAVLKPDASFTPSAVCLFAFCVQAITLKLFG
jgi:hypothetical protein